MGSTGFIAAPGAVPISTCGRQIVNAKPAHQAASVERLVNSSLMLGEGYQKLMTAHIASIGSKKG